MSRKETKHERFLRLAERRVGRALDELRLISQLSSPNYENTPTEAEAIVSALDESVRYIASVFGVDYATQIGKAASQTVNNASPIQRFQKSNPLDEIEIVKALEHLANDNIEEAEKILRAGLNGQRNAA